jgi:uncharacterized protein YkwD
MKSRLNFALGFILGAAIFGGSAAVATGIIAQPTKSAVVVNGTEMYIASAYNIDGNNYFKLRDVANVIDFSVVWDGTGNRILIDTTRGYSLDETYAESPPAQVGTTASIEEMKAEFIRLTNNERVKAGLPELEILPVLMDIAQAKADDMQINKYYGHTSPVYGTPSNMIKEAIPNWKGCAENLAPWNRTPQDAFASLMDSPRHREIILSPEYTYIGVGIIEGLNGGYWWVQQFVAV